MKHRRWMKKKLFLALTFLEKEWKKGNSVPELERECFVLNKLIEERNGDAAYPVIERIDAYLKKHEKKSFFWYLGEIVLTLSIALLVAGIIRQTWFELYEIPTGSMRDTFKERDRVLVSKSAFGINVPFQTKHVIFDENRLERGDIVVITTDGLDLPDTDTKYFGIFPGKKRYVKRAVALPGDHIYFYGGDLFCLAKDEKTIIRLKDIPSLREREFLPFISSFEGRIEVNTSTSKNQGKSILIKHINKPLGKIDILQGGTAESRIAYKNDFVREFSPILTQNDAPRTIGDFFGIKNFAVCRLLLPEELPKEAKTLGYSDSQAVAWLELRHSPTLPYKRSTQNALFSLLSTSTTWIPLHEFHFKELLKGLYTARLVVKNGRVHRYYFENIQKSEIPIPFERIVPNGTYEFFRGKAFEIGFGGTSFPLDAQHPIYPQTAKELTFLFNTGIDVSPETLSSASWKMPTRFAYFRDGSFIVMGTEIFTKDDPILASFVEKEMARQSKDYSYYAFLDSGSPDKEPLNIEFFKNFGFEVPEKTYLLLGDNPAMSVDSRYFGPVPQENIQGTPVVLFWPFGPRWGFPVQPPIPLSPYSVTFGVIACVIFCAISLHQKKRRKALLERLTSIGRTA